MIYIKKILKYIKENLIFIIVMSIIILLFYIELPYQIYIPGGIINLSDRVSVEDGYSHKGSINSSYVTALKGNIPFILLSYVIPNWDLINLDQITYEDESLNESMTRDTALLQESLKSAEIVALKEAKIDYKIINQKVKILYVYGKSKSNLLVGDVVLKVNNISVSSINELKSKIVDLSINEEINFTIIRNNKQKVIKGYLTTIESEKLLGVLLTEEFDVKTNKAIKISSKKRESGPSAGLMTALTVYNSLIDNDLAKGRKVVGTGTIDVDGNVGEIGGIKYKLLGAINAQAEIFICPKENYNEAIKVRNKNKSNIKIFGVSSFNEALTVLNNN